MVYYIILYGIFCFLGGQVTLLAQRSTGEESELSIFFFSYAYLNTFYTYASTAIFFNVCCDKKSFVLLFYCSMLRFTVL